MKALLDTNVVIHREAATAKRDDIGVLFRWLDRLQYTKCIHPLTMAEVRTHRDPKVVRTFEAKLKSYHILQTTAPDTAAVQRIRLTEDRSQNDANDTTLLNELASNRVDYLITEDRDAHSKAALLGIGHKVFTIDAFLEKVIAENPEFKDYEVLSIRRELFGKIDLQDDFFDSFRSDYRGFDSWFNSKSEEHAYVCTDDTGKLAAFLYLKVEDAGEDYRDISPPLTPRRRLKIGTFKVVSNGHKLGERFLKIVFDNAVRFQVDEVYVTVFDNGVNRTRLINLLQDWGFQKHGVKTSESGSEVVLVRACLPDEVGRSPRTMYPYASRKARKFIVPIYPQYHTELFPDSVLRTESPDNFVESRPNRNAISKVYISRSIERQLREGDIIVFYRTKSGGSAWYTSVATTLGVVERVVTRIRDLPHFVELCRKRSVFSDEELGKHWNYNPRNRPFIVNFLYLYTLPKRMNLEALVNARIISDAPRGFELLSNESFERLLEGSNADRRVIVD